MTKNKSYLIRVNEDVYADLNKLRHTPYQKKLSFNTVMYLLLIKENRNNRYDELGELLSNVKEPSWAWEHAVEQFINHYEKSKQK